MSAAGAQIVSLTDGTRTFELARMRAFEARMCAQPEQCAPHLTSGGSGEPPPRWTPPPQSPNAVTRGLSARPLTHEARKMLHVRPDASL